MQPRIVDFPEKIMVGKQIRMSHADNKTGGLWQSFMPLRHQIKNIVSADFYSLEVYDPDFFTAFNPIREFIKWAAQEVTSFDELTSELETIRVPAGLYAVFIHQGAASRAPTTYRYIFETWLPQSGYRLDNRPHLAIMGKKYKNEDPNSEEEIAIPIQAKI